MIRRRTPRTLSMTLERLEGEWAPRTLLADVQRAWPGAVGEAIVREAAPAAAREGTVTVTCSSSLWAHELDLMSPGIIDALNAALGAERVLRLRCQAAPPRGRA